MLQSIKIKGKAKIRMFNYPTTKVLMKTEFTLTFYATWKSSFKHYTSYYPSQLFITLESAPA